jgi:hypothetical protein
MHMAMGLWEVIPRSGEFQELLEPMGEARGRGREFNCYKGTSAALDTPRVLILSFGQQTEMYRTTVSISTGNKTENACINEIWSFVVEALCYNPEGRGFDSR